MASPHVLLVSQDAPDCLLRPFAVSMDIRYTHFAQTFCNIARGILHQASREYPPHDPGFLLVDCKHSVRALVEAEEIRIGNGNLPVGEALAHAPFDVLADGSGLVLSKRAHDGEHHFSLAVECPDVLLLDNNFCTID